MMRKMGACLLTGTAAVLLLLLLLTASSQAFLLDEPDPPIQGEITPQKPHIVLEGDELELLCNITHSARPIDSRNIYFQFGIQRLGDELIEYGPTWIRLRWPNMLHNYTFGHMFCYCTNCSDTEPQPLAQVSITVHRRPLTPNITGCIVYNWKRMECEWTPTADEQRQHTGLVTNQTLYWTVFDPAHNHCKENSCWYRCPHPDTRSCTWLHPDPSSGLSSYYIGSNYSMCLVMENELIVAQCDKPIFFVTAHLVKPDPVSRVRNHSSAEAIMLVWDPPKDINWRIVQYRVNYTSQWDLSNTKPVLLNNITRLNISGLVPNTQYQVTIECIPLVTDHNPHAEKKYTAKGFWSNKVTLNIYTETNVPGMAPGVTNGSFIVSETSADKRNVQVYIKSIPAQLSHGRVEAVRVCHQPKNANRSMCALTQTCRECVCQECRVDKNRPCTLTNTTVSNADTYVVTVNARTDKGYNDDLLLTPITVMPQNDIKPMRQALESVVIIGDNNGPGVHVNWTRVQGAVQYTVYMCKGRDQCRKDSELRWVTVPGSQLHQYIPLETEYGKYVFAVSAERKLDDTCAGLASSGMVFYSNCIYDMDKSIALPNDFGFAPPEEQEGESLVVTWKPPTCSESSYIQNYTIRLCTKENCGKGIFDSTVVVAAARTPEQRKQISNLIAGEEYYAYIQSVSPHAETNFAKTEEAYRVTQSGLGTMVIVMIAIGCVAVSVIAFIGAYTITKACRKHYKRYAQGPQIVLPVVEEESMMPPNSNGVDIGSGTAVSYTPYTSQQNHENYMRQKRNQDDMNGNARFNDDASRGVPVDSLPTEPLLPPELPPPNSSSSLSSRPDTGAITDYSQLAQAPTDYIQRLPELLNPGVHGPASSAPTTATTAAAGGPNATNNNNGEQNKQQAAAATNGVAAATTTRPQQPPPLPPANNNSPPSSERAARREQPPELIEEEEEEEEMEEEEPEPTSSHSWEPRLNSAGYVQTPSPSVDVRQPQFPALAT